MKAILEFDLPDERPEYDTARRGAEFSSALWEIREILRRIRKHEIHNERPAIQKFFEKIDNELISHIPEDL